MTAEPFPHDFHDSSVGITFHLPSRRSFVPNAWLLHAGLNQQGTRIEIHYTHCLVTIEGRNLGRLYDQIAKFGLSWIRELRMATPDEPSVTRIELSEKTED